MLCDQGEASLDTVTQRTGYPKASVLRMLQTLCALQLVERSDQTGSYRALARIVYSTGSGPAFEARVQQVIESISAKLHLTVEWFEPGEDGLLLSRRASPPEAEVAVKAHSGYIREWGDELDAIGTIGYAFCTGARNGYGGLWTYDPKGDHVNLTVAESTARIEKAKKDRLFIDPCYNRFGVKRAAVPVMRSGQLAGVLSLACVFTPSLDLEISDKTAALRLAASELEGF